MKIFIIITLLITITSCSDSKYEQNVRKYGVSTYIECNHDLAKKMYRQIFLNQELERFLKRCTNVEFHKLKQKNWLLKESELLRKKGNLMTFRLSFFEDNNKVLSRKITINSSNNDIEIVDDLLIKTKK